MGMRQTWDGQTDGSQYNNSLTVSQASELDAVLLWSGHIACTECKDAAYYCRCSVLCVCVCVSIEYSHELC